MKSNPTFVVILTNVGFFILYDCRRSKMNKKIQITNHDYKKLLDYLKTAKIPGGIEFDYIQKLKDEIEKAEIVEAEKIDSDVITMNSIVVVKDIETGEIEKYELVFPELANIDEGKISILAPVGCALLGYRVMDEIELNVPSGIRRIRIEAVLYQPESKGIYTE
ncbi:MAG TPA: GreA/GreB family elongation factor [Candidatus Goldiibacteriota bacterium]|nr:GreA/GreB family elongation factor [Candidatus Goldiibacteriota bacterium]